MLSKKQQTKSNRLRPKPSMKNNRKASKEDKEYLQYLQTTDYACLVCGTRSVIEWHHVKEHSTDRKNHKRLIPLCSMHHRLSLEISAHGTPRKFKEVFPMEKQYEISDQIYSDYIDKKL